MIVEIVLLIGAIVLIGTLGVLVGLRLAPRIDRWEQDRERDDVGPG